MHLFYTYVYVSMCVYMCVCVCTYVCMSLRTCTVWPHSSFSYISGLTRHDIFLFTNPPPPHTYRVVFTLSIIIRSLLVVVFHLPPLSFEKIPRKSCNKSMHIFVSKLHPPPTLHAKTLLEDLDVNASSSDTTAAPGTVYNVVASIF